MHDSTAQNSLYACAADPCDGDGALVRPGADGQSSVDLPRIERAVREILIAVGENPDR